MKQPSPSALTTRQKKRFRSIGHQLKPIVTISTKGVSGSVETEINRALGDHELIKVRLVGERAERDSLLATLLGTINCTLIQQVGGIALIYRPAREPNPHLSNLLRSHG